MFGKLGRNSNSLFRDGRFKSGVAVVIDDIEYYSGEAKDFLAKLKNDKLLDTYNVLFQDEYDKNIYHRSFLLWSKHSMEFFCSILQLLMNYYTASAATYATSLLFT